MTGLSDSFHRPIDYLRISVTDRCNLRCIYCMPLEGVRLIAHEDLLTFEEIHLVAKAAAALGISKLRLTGGEPLVRLGLPRLVKMLSGIDGIDDIALTTNGLLLSRYAAELKEAGLRRVNISLDTLQEDRFSSITRGRASAEDVLDGIRAAEAVGLSPIKINMVVMSGVNDDELVSFARKTIDEAWHVRFIEVMPLTGDILPSAFVSVDEMKRRIEPLGALEPCKAVVGNGPAKYFRFPGARGTVGFITPVTEHFCFNCNRLRLTSDGKLRPCLLAEDEIDLRQALRGAISFDDLKGLIRKAVAHKPLRHRMGEGNVPRRRPYSQVGG